MIMTKTVTWTLEPQSRPWGERMRARLARGLRRVGAQLARLARRWGRSPSAPRPREPVFEFYAEAGAPEGALFVDGQRVGVLDGVTRL
jgi:hypothetical protein